MLVTELRHFLDLPEDTPGPARRLAQHLGNIVRAATYRAPVRRHPEGQPALARLIDAVREIL